MIASPLERQVTFELVNALVACIRGPKGRAEIRFIVDPQMSPEARFIVRQENKAFDCVYLRPYTKDIVCDEPAGITLRDAIALAKTMVGASL